VARYGGEEFVVILPFTQRDVVLGLAERVRAEIESVSWEQRAITVSIGVGTMTSDVKTPADLVALSDEALYHSKLTGRNRVTHMNELPHKDPAATVVG
jgi:diguanylate cyclase (GGDEF)-like protein